MLGSIKTYQKKISKTVIPDIALGINTAIMLVCIAVAFGFAIWWLNHTSSSQHIWETFPLDKKIPLSFCEKIEVSNPVRQPINTFSNIVYLIVSIIVFKNAWKERHNENSNDLITLSTAYSFLFAFILLYVFFASSFYHAALIPLAQRLDYSAVFAFSLFPIIFLLHRRWLIKKDKLRFLEKGKRAFAVFSVYLLTVLLLSLLVPRGKESLTALILIQFFLWLAFFATIDKSDYHQKSYLVLSIASVFIALMFFEFDKYKILCSPNSYFQTHSFWNLFIGLSAFYFYLYMRSEPGSDALVIKMKDKTQHV